MKNDKAPAALLIILLLILTVPIPAGIYKDGGTRDYRALAYRIVVWNRMLSDEEMRVYHTDTYHRTSFYLFPYNFKSIDELWKIEQKRR